MKYNLYQHKDRHIYVVENLKTSRCWGDYDLNVCIKQLNRRMGWIKDEKTLRNYVFIDTISRETHPEYFI